jgi:peptide subunit release factor 1 (eRF1)
MQKSTSALVTPLRNHLDRLSSFEPSEDAPVLSLYLDAHPDQHGRDQYDTWLRKTFHDRSRTLKGGARQSFEQDVERITAFLADAARPSANGFAIFACSARGLFDTIQVDVPFEDHWLFLGSVPHLYPLVRLIDQYPRYAALLADTNSARLFVFGLGAVEGGQEVRNVKTRKTSAGGWSQARYQRRLSNFHLHHMKEVVDTLERVVRDERINQIVLSCDEVTKPTILEQMPRHLADKVIDIVRLDINAPEHDVLTTTLEALRGRDAQTDAEQVAALITAWRSNGLGVVGPEDTLQALEMGQVEELLITTTPETLRAAESLPAPVSPGPIEVDTSGPATGVDADRLKLAGELVAKAQQTNARVRFIEDADLLSDVGGVGALLRFKI